MWFAIKLILWIVFLGSAILLATVVLLQESKGGGLAEAFGGVGAETFGVKTRGISKFTFTLAGCFVGSALALHMLWNA